VKLSPEYQAAIAIAIVSDVVAFLLVGLSNLKYMMLALVLNIVLLYSFSLCIRFFEGLRLKSSAEVRAKERIGRVLALPFEDVKQHALAVIEDGHHFRCKRGNFSSNPAIGRLGPVLRDFFANFESVEQVGGDFFVSRNIVGDSSLRPGFIKIGTDFAHSELLVRPGEDQVFIVTDCEHNLDGLPTIYHNIYLLGDEDSSRK
jgi:hypothetical protein